jgi:hypothetical protein
MQRLFSMFPPGWPGIGLLLLRSSVAFALLAESYPREGLPGWLRGATILLSLILFAGYLTPIAAAIGLVLHGLISFKFGGDSAAVTLIVSLDAVALALIGPGAYSVDASRFGRRVLALPPN